MFTLTKNSTVTKSDVNPNVELSSETSLSRNTHKKGMSRGTRNSNLASDTEAENTGKGKTSEQSTLLDFLPLIQPGRNPQENEGLKLTMRVKSQ